MKAGRTAEAPAGLQQAPKAKTGRGAEAASSGSAAGRSAAPWVYIGTCAALGAVLGWMPLALHGPAAGKFDVHGIDGSFAVWAFYGSRLMIGVWVGLTRWPSPWFLRGPLCGAIAMLPVTFISLAVPECGPGCMAYNLTTATVVGFAVAALAFAVTGRHHA